MRKLGIERLAIAETTAKELGPFRDGEAGIDFFGEEIPKLRMMPAEVMAGAVTVLADACAEFFDFGDELVPVQVLEVFVHKLASLSVRKENR